MAFDTLTEPSAKAAQGLVDDVDGAVQFGGKILSLLPLNIIGTNKRARLLRQFAQANLQGAQPFYGERFSLLTGRGDRVDRVGR